MADVRPFEVFASLHIVAADRRVELTRTTAAFANTAELQAYWSSAIERTGSVVPTPSENWSVLTDLRLAKGRNDEAFERMMTLARRPFYARFSRSAVVVASLVGRMHVARSTQQDEPDTCIFDNLDAARQWLSAD